MANEIKINFFADYISEQIRSGKLGGTMYGSSRKSIEETKNAAGGEDSEFDHQAKGQGSKAAAFKAVKAPKVPKMAAEESDNRYVNFISAQAKQNHGGIFGQQPIGFKDKEIEE